MSRSRPSSAEGTSRSRPRRITYRIEKSIGASYSTDHRTRDWGFRPLHVHRYVPVALTLEASKSPATMANSSATVAGSCKRFAISEAPRARSHAFA